MQLHTFIRFCFSEVHNKRLEISGSVTSKMKWKTRGVTHKNKQYWIRNKHSTVFKYLVNLQPLPVGYQNFILPHWHISWNDCCILYNIFQSLVKFIFILFSLKLTDVDCFIKLMICWSVPQDVIPSALNACKYQPKRLSERYINVILSSRARRYVLYSYCAPVYYTVNCATWKPQDHIDYTTATIHFF